MAEQRLPKFVRCGDMSIAIKTIQYVCIEPEFSTLKFTNGDTLDITQDKADELKQSLKDRLDFICRNNVIIAKSEVKLIVQQADHIHITFLNGMTGKLTPGADGSVETSFAYLHDELNA
jgi:hypothetical protein